MRYTISFQNPLNHFVDISLEFKTFGKRLVELNLPAWRPGRYELANYARNIRGVNAADKLGRSLQISKSSRNQWRLETSSSTVVCVNYQFYAFQLDAGGSLLDDSQLYLNFINCLLYSKDLIATPCSVLLLIPKNFLIACGLPRDRSGKLIARDYYQLVDSPLIASPKLKHWRFQRLGVQFHLWFMGANRLNKVRVINDFKSFITQQIKTMGSFPVANYHFMFQTPAHSVYHGVEHGNSTIIALGPGPELHRRRYQDFLGVSSHELFHCWNILKIRPKELLPYDFQREVYFDTGFAAEGITSYYGDLFLVRSGVYDRKQYFKKINRLFKRHFENEGRQYASLVESSRDLWVDGYQSGAPGRKVSIYTKGALVSLLLDLTIRERSGNEHSMDQVMISLWNDFGKKEKGYSLADFRIICETVAGSSLKEFFQSYIYGTISLEEELARLLTNVGCRLKKVSSKQISKRKFGFRMAKTEQGFSVSQLAAGSPVSKKLSVGDQLVKINGRKPNRRFNHLIELRKPLRLEIERAGRRKKLTLKPSKGEFFGQYKMAKHGNPSPQQIECFKSWLGIDFET